MRTDSYVIRMLFFPYFSFFGVGTFSGNYNNFPGNLGKFLDGAFYYLFYYYDYGKRDKVAV